MYYLFGTSVLDYTTSINEKLNIVDNQNADNEKSHILVSKLIVDLKASLDKLFDADDLKKAESICKRKVEEIEDIIKGNSTLKNEYKVFFEAVVECLDGSVDLCDVGRYLIEGENLYKLALAICEKYLKDPMKTSVALENLGSMYSYLKRFVQFITAPYRLTLVTNNK